VKVSIEALPGKLLDATVSRISGAIDEATRTMIIEADLPNKAGAMRPGMYASVKVGVEHHDNVLTIPVEALAMEKTNAFVFKAAEGKAKKTAVTLGFNDGARAEVLTGLAEGDPVILVGKATFTDGQPVQVTE
jgi:membrane fusion protein (multidrug efflux system)